MGDRFRDPRGRLLDKLPWAVRRFYIARAVGERYRDVPSYARIIGCRRPSDRVIAYFRELHRQDKR